jgi:hypothetical protein
MRQITIFILLALMVVSIGADAQTRSSAGGSRRAAFRPDTGDADIDRHLQEIDRYGMAEFAAFKKELASKFSGSRRDVSRIYPRDKIEPGDIFIEPGEIFIEPGEIFKPGDDPGSLLARPGDAYYAFALSAVTGTPAGTIINSFARNRNWGAVTSELGIKPGSKEFAALKGRVMGGIGKVPGKSTDGTPGARPARRM